MKTPVGYHHPVAVFVKKGSCFCGCCRQVNGVTVVAQNAGKHFTHARLVVHDEDIFLTHKKVPSDTARTMLTASKYFVKFNLKILTYFGIFLAVPHL